MTILLLKVLSNPIEDLGLGVKLRLLEVKLFREIKWVLTSWILNNNAFLY